MAKQGSRISTTFQVSLDGPAFTDRCVCLFSPFFRSEQLLARMHLCSGRSIFHSAPFGCPVHQWQLSHTITDEGYSVFLHYEADGFPRSGQRCSPVHAEFTLLNSNDDELTTKEFKRAFMARTSWGFDNLITLDALRSDEHVKKDGLVVCQVMVYGLEGRMFTEEFMQLKNDGKLCDVLLVLDGGEVEAHAVVLAARSEYFAGLLENAQANVQARITIPEKVEVMKAIVDYLYVGYVDAPHDMNMDLYTAADSYGLDKLKSLLAARLASNVTLDNLVEMAKLAWDHDDEVLKETLTPLLRENMGRLKEREEFKNLVDMGGYGGLVLKLLEVGSGSSSF